MARESLRELIEDTRLPRGVRESLVQDYESVEAMFDKLKFGHLHIAVLGRVSTGKSSLLNALIGEPRFAVSPLHGETRKSAMERWSEVEAGGLYLIDTPGLDEAGGEDRESLAREVANRADLVIFVLDSDIIAALSNFDCHSKTPLRVYTDDWRFWPGFGVSDRLGISCWMRQLSRLADTFRNT